MMRLSNRRPQLYARHHWMFFKESSGHFQPRLWRLETDISDGNSDHLQVNGAVFKEVYEHFKPCLRRPKHELKAKPQCFPDHNKGFFVPQPNQSTKNSIVTRKTQKTEPKEA